MQFLTCTRKKATFILIQKHVNSMRCFMHSRLYMLLRYNARCSDRYLMTMTFHLYLFSQRRELAL